MGILQPRTTRRTSRRAGRRTLVASMTGAILVLAAAAGVVTPAAANDDPDRSWASVDAATGYVDNMLGCTWAVCGDPESFFRQDYERRGFLLLDVERMGLSQLPGPGWWYLDSTFVRDVFELNLSARADILSVHLSWSTGGLGPDLSGVTYTVTIGPGGRTVTLGGFETSLTLDPLPADVVHTFSIAAALPDGRTIAGPTVTATPKPDPDPDCVDTRVARECRKATSWAAVHPDTGIVGNVIVCTTEQCGPDGPWGGISPADTPTPGYLLVELTGPGGIGWEYVDGTFVDVRPREEPFAPAPTAPSDGSTDRTGASTGSAVRPPGSAPSDADFADDRDASGVDSNGADGGERDGGVAESDVLRGDEDSSSSAATDASVATAQDGVPTDVSGAPGNDSDSADAGAVGDGPGPLGAVRRVIDAVVAFFTDLFRR